MRTFIRRLLVALVATLGLSAGVALVGEAPASAYAYTAYYCPAPGRSGQFYWVATDYNTYGTQNGYDYVYAAGGVWVGSFSAPKGYLSGTSGYSSTGMGTLKSWYNDGSNYHSIVFTYYGICP